MSWNDAPTATEIGRRVIHAAKVAPVVSVWVTAETPPAQPPCPGARVTQPRDGHPIAAGRVRDTLAEQLHDADSLVPRNERQRRLDRPVAARGVDVGVAQSAGLDPVEDFPAGGLRHGPVHDLQRPAVRGHHCRLS